MFGGSTIVLLQPSTIVLLQPSTFHPEKQNHALSREKCNQLKLFYGFLCLYTREM